jgi:copper homeostasis protein
MLIEACIDSLESAIAAEEGGAGRLELCAALHDGGTTPSAGTIACVAERVGIPVFVLVRPRGGSFVHSDDEIRVMLHDIRHALSHGAKGIAIGVLLDDGTIDVSSMRRLIDAAGGAPVTFHRAFDRTPDLLESLDTLAALGVQRVLTSGGAQTALEGRDGLARLVSRAAGRVTIMAGGGIREENVAAIVAASGVEEVHVRATRARRTTVQSARPFSLRKPLPADEDAWEETDPGRIREIVTRAAGGASAS